MSKTYVASESELLLIRVTCLAWLITKLMSWKLWVSYRIFPIIPVFDSFVELPDSIHFLLLGLSLTALLLVLIFPRTLAFIIFAFCFEIFSCLIDQMRWQPWQFQYLLTFGFLLYSYNKPHNFLKLTGILIGVTYFYSGLHKLSSSFLHVIWIEMVLKGFGGFSSEFTSHSIVRFSGLLLGLIEIATGLGLLFFKHKRIFVCCAIVMHGLILLVLGPFGLNFNQVVWPWNILMSIFVWIIFYKNSTNLDATFFRPIFHKLIFIFIGILPTLNFVGLWDSYLSFNLYSGKSKRVFFCSEKEFIDDRLTSFYTFNKVSKYCSEESISISLNKMSLQELNVPVYPEERVYKSFKKQWLIKYPNSKNTFIIYDYPYQIKDIRIIE